MFYELTQENIMEKIKLFGFKEANNKCVDICTINSLITPIAYKDVGDYAYCLIAQFKNQQDKYIVFNFGGSNCFDYDDNKKKLKEFTYEDSLSSCKLISLLAYM